MASLIDATAVKVGNSIIIDNEPCIVKGLDKSKTGKHGASKVRIEAIGIIDDKKRIIARPGHERFEVPMIDKRKGQILSITADKASVMDLENFETIEMPFSEEVKEQLKENTQVEYWSIGDRRIIKRMLSQ
jgi:translation initiation factor 5A